MDCEPNRPMKMSRLALIFPLFLITVGAIINAASVIVFLSPFDIAPSGVSGLAVILNTLFKTPIGIMTFLMNLPIQYLGYRMLPNGRRVIAQTIWVVVIYSVSLDMLARFVPAKALSNDALLMAIFGGIIGGLSSAMIIRGGATLGGTSTLALILQQRTGTPLSTTYLYTDMAVVVVAGLVYGWEGALYATIVIFISGMATDYALEGPSVIRTVFIITDKPQPVSHAIMDTMHRGVTSWEAVGMYTQQTRNVLYITISRSQVDELRRIVNSVDDHAFLVVGQGHTAYGEGFKVL
jgi:uncharacterized membrane-anchored protein YitT (DUF2179 family)